MKLKGFADVPWDSVFTRYLLQKHYDNNPRTKSNWFWLKRIIHSALFKVDVFDEDITGYSILFFSSFTGRKSIMDNFLKVRNLVKSDLITMSSKKQVMDLPHLFGIVFSLPNWSKSLKIYNLNSQDHLQLLYETTRLYRLHKLLSKSHLEHYKAIVTFYDSFLMESYAVEYARLLNVKSIVLQHGQFISWRADTFFDCGIEFRTFKSDYFLCWNKYTYDEAIRFGIAPERLVVTGIWSYIGVKREKCRQNNNGIFGVVIGHPSWESENQVLIESANLLSSKYNLKYYLKLHPNYPNDAYDSAINDKCVGLIPKGISMMEYADIVDFSLVGSSSVFTELVFIGHGVFRYSSGEANDKYNAVELGNYFNNQNQLLDLYSSESATKDSDALFDYLCTVSDTTSSYKQFLSQFE